jgi:hypothetical protein
VLSAKTNRGAREPARRIETLKQQAPPEPDMACAVEEGEPVDQKVFIRGDYGSPGEDGAESVFPAILGRDTDPRINGGSGRLANWRNGSPSRNIR